MAGAATAIPAGTVFAQNRAATPADYTALRERRFEALTGGGFDPSDPLYEDVLATIDSAAEVAVAKLVRASGRDRVFEDYPFGSQSTYVRDTYNRLRQMAIAYATPGTRLNGDASLLEDTLLGLKDVHRLQYHAGKGQYDSWYQWQIGAPHALVDSCVLLYDHIDPDDLAAYMAAVEHFIPVPGDKSWPDPKPFTGSNLVDSSLICVMAGALAQREQRMEQAMEALSRVFVYSNDGDGFYRDGSYIMHRTIAYNGSYGEVLIIRLSYLFHLVAGSPWEVDDPNHTMIHDMVEKAYQPFIFNGEIMSSVLGRAISRHAHNGRAHVIIEGILRMAETVDDETARRWKAMCKGWLTRDTSTDPLKTHYIERVTLFNALLTDTSIEPTPEPVGHWQFSGMARAVHRRPGWAFSIAMASKRIDFYEFDTTENLRGWHTGAGMTYLYLDNDNVQFNDNFWPTVDHRLYPGITLSRRELNERKDNRGSCTWVGGATLGGYGVVGQDLRGPRELIEARKSWFCLDEGIVALGAGISSNDTMGVRSVIENRHLHENGVNKMIIDDVEQPLDLGWEQEFTNPNWGHIENVGGYLFLGNRKVTAFRVERSGRWKDINRHRYTEELHTRRFAGFFYSHGVGPVNANYGYMILPNATVERTRELATGRKFAIMANNANLQAVEARDIGLMAVNFFKAGRTVETGDGVVIASEATDNAPAVMMHRDGDNLYIGVSEPRRVSNRVIVEVGLSGYRLVEASSHMTVDVGGAIRLTADTSEHDGRTHTAHLVAE
ncbi:MAG TPA: polysaccharide lyase 8 family protein [Candidatus Stackebrandtia excrementipullorum]|nr:polysaccharide lyase 8 family protein [Candidatus Stackebrandtia excrementipullorum]